MAGSTESREVGGRYLIGSALAETDAVRTFEATDRWLRREVRFAVATAAAEKELGITAKAVAARQCPHVVAVYDCGVADGKSYVVFERTAVLDQVVDGEFPWRTPAQVRKAICSLTAGLADLRAIGVQTPRVDPTSIGADGSGNVKVSPWPLSQPDPAHREWDDLALALYILGRATLHAPEQDAVALTEIFHRLRQPAGPGAIADLQQLMDELDAAEPSESEVTGQMWVSERMAFLGSTDSPRIFARRTSRPRWPVPAGAAALILLLIGFLTFGLQTSTPPASGDRHGAQRCVGAAAQCGAHKSSRSSSTSTPSKVPLPPPANTSVLGTTLANPGPTPTPASTTLPDPGSTTTTAPSETTTTTPQTTTTTTAPSVAP